MNEFQKKPAARSAKGAAPKNGSNRFASGREGIGHPPIFSRGEAEPTRIRERTIERPDTRQDISRRPAGTLPHKAPEAVGNEHSLEEKIISLHKQGMSPDQIAKTTARQRHRVVYTLQKAGLYPQKKTAAMA